MRGFASVSVLMAVHDGLPHLPAAVDSILSQSYEDFEFLVIDDHSADQSRSYLDSITDSRLRVLSNPGRGLTAALNFGMNQAKSEWIARMDADDWSSPVRLERQIEAARTPGIVLVSADVIVCDEGLRPVGEIRLADPNPNLFDYLKKKNNPFTHPVMMFHRKTALEVGGYRHERAQDYDLWIRMLERGQLAHVDRVLLKYRVARSGVSIRHVGEQKDMRDTIRHSGPPRRVNSSRNPSWAPASGGATNDGQYYYRLGFASWLSGRRAPALGYLGKSVIRGTNVAQSLAAIGLMVLPRRVYLDLAGYRGVYR